MTAEIRTRLRPTGFTVLALGGVWLAHSLEYGRVAGVRGLTAGLSGPVHGYMPIAGALLLATAILFGAELVAAWRMARQRAAFVRRQLRLALRGHVVVARPEPRQESSQRLRARTLFLGLAAAQIVLYVLQENLEAGLAGSAAPGIGAILGVHWAAPLIHLAVAALLTSGITCVRWLVGSRDTRRRRVEALLRRVADRLRGGVGLQVPHLLSTLARTPAPGQCRRAPPAVAAI